MSQETIEIIRSGLDYAQARQSIQQLSDAAPTVATAREIATLREAIDRWESVCGLPGSPAKAEAGLPRVA